MHDLAGGGDGREEPAEHGDDDAAETAANQHTLVDQLVTQMDAIQGRFGNAAEQAGRQSAQRSCAHVLVLVADGQEQHAGGGAEAGEVPHAHRALDEVVAEGLNVHEHQGVERPVQAERHQERIQQRNQDGEDERSVVVEPCQADAEDVAGPYADRTDDECGERTHDDHGEERHEHELYAVRNDPLQSVVHEGEHRGHEQRHEHVAAVVTQLHRQAEDVGGAGGGAESRILHAHGGAEGLGVHQAYELRGHEHRHDGAAQPRVDLELFGGVVGDHDRQEVEHALPDGLDEHPACGCFIVRDHAEGDQQVHQRDDDGGAEQHAQNRAEGV